MKQIVIVSLCLALAGVAFAQQGAGPKKLTTVKWADVGKIFKEKESATPANPAKEVLIGWQKGDKWTVEVYSKDSTEKTSVIKWLPTPREYQFEVLGSEVKDKAEVYRLTVVETDRPETKVTFLVDGVTRKVKALVKGDKEAAADRLEIPGVWDFPGGTVKGKEYESPLGVPRDAVIFSEGVVGFPAAEVPQSGGKVVDVEFKNGAGDDCFQRWDETIPQFPLCSYTLTRVTLLREVTRK